MQRIDSTTSVPTPPPPKSTVSPGYCADGNPATGAQSTQLNADWFNGVQEELMSFLTFLGIAPLKGVTNQVLTAVQTMIMNAINAIALGLAAFKGVTDNSQANAVMAKGAFTPGHLLVAADPSGTAEDGGPAYGAQAVVTVTTGPLVPGPTPGQIYRTTASIAVSLNPSGLPAGWSAWFEVPVGGAGYFALQPSGAYTIDGQAQRFVYPGARVGICWNGSAFETYAGEYFVSFTVTSWGASQVLGPYSHNLGNANFDVECIATCTASGGEAGYSQGDAVKVGSYYDSGYARGFSVVKMTATGLSIVIPANLIMVFNYTTQVATQITPSKWSLTFNVRAR